MPERLVFALPSSPKRSRARAFTLSLCIHAVAVALLRTASHSGWLDVAPSPYRERIAGQEHRIIYYPRSADLPPVAPAESAPEMQGRPERKLRQKIAATSRKPESRRQMILQSPPEIRLPQDLPVPNVVMWNAPPLPPRPRFEMTPRVRSAPQSRELIPAPHLDVPANPVATAPLQAIELPARRKFELPAAPVRASRPAALPVDQAPDVGSLPMDGSALARVQPVGPVARPRFVAPERRGTGGRKPSLGDVAPPRIAGAGASNVAVVGLDPAPGTIAAPLPPGNRSAQFSGGPDGNGTDAGEPGASARAEVRIPNLAIAPAAAPTITRPPVSAPDRSDFRRQLLSSLPTSRPAPSAAGADPVLYGSTVYTLAIDMPNITSEEGSWIVRFTELGGSSPEDVLTAPVATRKVDPKYIASAAAEKIEGKVMLYAVIRRDGRVDQIRLVQGLDERLDASAVAAFAKWEFQPATKNGRPVDLEAVVQIPFRLFHKP